MGPAGQSGWEKEKGKEKESKVIGLKGLGQLGWPKSIGSARLKEERPARRQQAGSAQVSRLSLDRLG